jgi:hypothetical protein
VFAVVIGVVAWFGYTLKPKKPELKAGVMNKNKTRKGTHPSISIIQHHDLSTFNFPWEMQKAGKHAKRPIVLHTIC